MSNLPVLYQQPGVPVVQPGVPAIPGLIGSYGPAYGPGIPMGPTIFNPLALGPGAGPQLPDIYSAPRMAAGAGMPGQLPLSGTIAQDIAGGAGGAGGIGDAASKASFMSRFAPEAGLTFRSAALRAAPFVGAGQLATLAINKVLPSTGQAGNVRQVLGDAATWAGIGAGVGSVIPGLGTAAGGVAGGTGGALYGLFDSIFGEEDTSKDDFRNNITASAQQLGLPQPQQYSAIFDLLTKAGGDPKQVSAQLANQIISDASTYQQQQQYAEQQRQQRAADQHFALALQAQAQEFFGPYTNNIISSAATQADLLKGLAQQVPGPYRGVLENQAAQGLARAQQLAGAYAMQSALAPSQFMAHQELKRQQEIEQLQYRQAVIQSQQGGGGGANQLLQQLAAQAQG